MAKLKGYLARRGVQLVVGAEAEVELNGRSGAFRPLEDGTARLLLRAEPKTETVWHELGHFIHWRLIGPDAYRELPRTYGNNAPEQFVFNLLQNPLRWDRLTPEYRIRMNAYITDTWGGLGR